MITTKEAIIRKIQQLAEQDGGRPPGQTAFASKTGIANHKWLGVHWVNWTSALAEAGFEGLSWNKKLNSENVLREVGKLALQLGSLPTKAELLFHSKKIPALPTPNTIRQHFKGHAGLAQALRNLGAKDLDFSDLLTIIPDIEQPESPNQTTDKNADGWVYLINSGDAYKLGCSENLERRIKQISVSLPEAATLFHAIQTDDPFGIESYWHKRFEARRLNGEWFKLRKQDIAAFKRRKFM